MSVTDLYWFILEWKKAKSNFSTEGIIIGIIHWIQIFLINLMKIKHDINVSKKFIPVLLMSYKVWLL